jgi:hypothetical protein
MGLLLVSDQQGRESQLTLVLCGDVCSEYFLLVSCTLKRYRSNIENCITNDEKYSH